MLVRDEPGKACTMGRLHLANELIDTLERPWVGTPNTPGGRKGVSCVPPGLYKLFRHDSEAHPRTWALVNPNLDVYHWDVDVPIAKRGLARTLVLLHAANWVSELRGCIAVGMQRGQCMIPGGASRPAMQRIQELVPWTSEHELEILYSATAGVA